MARPIKYKTANDKIDAARRAADVIKEIKGKSGLTYVELSKRLKQHGIVISDAMLRQYACARKPVGERLLTKLAEVAYGIGWSGDKCVEVLFFHNYEYSQSLKEFQKGFARYKELLERRLFLTIKELADTGYSGQHVRNLVKDALEKLVNEFDASGNYKV